MENAEKAAGTPQDFVVQGRPLAKQPKEKTLAYRIKAGAVLNHRVVENDMVERRQLKAGDTIELTEAQAKAFRDKVEPVGEGFVTITNEVNNLPNMTKNEAELFARVRAIEQQVMLKAPSPALGLPSDRVVSTSRNDTATTKSGEAAMKEAEKKDAK